MSAGRLVVLGLSSLWALHGSAAWGAAKESVPYSFAGGATGSGPVGGLLLGQHGSFFGTTGDAPGVVFQLLPPSGQAGWTEKIIHTFQHYSSTDGSSPSGALVADAVGNLYGVTIYGGSFGRGTVFELLPPTHGRSLWSERVIYSFEGGADGSNPVATLLLGPAGSLFGTTSGTSVVSGGKVSTAFELTPPASVDKPWTHTVIHSFDQPQDGRNALSGFTAGSGGSLYSVTEFGGTNGLGTVYMLTPPAQPGSTWVETVLYNFQNHGDASLPLGELIQDATGALFGTSAEGGLHFRGSVYELSPPAAGQTAWTEAVLHSFAQLDGQAPLGKLLMGSDGTLYGTTSDAGTYDGGTAFMLTPPASGGGIWTETVLHQFGAKSGDANAPQAGVTFNKQGAVFGTTEFGGMTNQGAIFKITR